MVKWSKCDNCNITIANWHFFLRYFWMPDSGPVISHLHIPIFNLKTVGSWKRNRLTAISPTICWDSAGFLQINPQDSPKKLGPPAETLSGREIPSKKKCQLIIMCSVLITYYVCRRPSWTPKTEPNDSRAAVWLSFWYSTRPAAHTGH